MIFDSKEAEALKVYLSTTVEPICDADPEKLADYVIALLKHDKPEKELKNLCINQLDEFLRDETENFINKLFEVLETKSYIDKPENLTSSIEEKSTDLKRSHEILEVQEQEPKEDSDQSDDDRNFKHTRKTRDTLSSSSSRKNEYEDQQPPPNKRHRFENKSNIKNDQNEKHLNRNSYVRGQQDKEINNSNEKLGKRRRNDENDGKGNSKYMRNINLNQNDDNIKNKLNYSMNPNQNNSNLMSSNKHQTSNSINPDYNYVNNQRGGGGNQRDTWYNQNNQNIQQIPNSQGRFRGRNDRNQQSFRNSNNNNGMYSKRRCIDYDEKGYCLKGDMCPFDHGMDRIVVDEITSNRRNFDNILPNNIPARIIPGINQTSFNHNHNQFINSNGIFESETVYSANAEGYDPEQASYASNIVPPQWGNTTIENIDNSFTNSSNSKLNIQEPNEEINSQPTLNTTQNENINTSVNTSNNGVSNISGSSNSSSRGRGGRGRGRGRGGFGFNRHGQQANKQPILNIENIPAEYFAIDKINNYFKKFGTIINITLNPRHYKATIQFNQYSEANLAHSSPDPIFGNRFVKLYWAKSSTEQSDNEDKNTEKEDNQISGSNNESSNNEKSKSTAEETTKLPPISEEEMIQIKLMKKSMVNRQLEKQKVLMKQIETNKNITPREKEDILKNIKLITESVKHIMNSSPQNIKILAGNSLFLPKESSNSGKNNDDKDKEDSNDVSSSSLTASSKTQIESNNTEVNHTEQPKLTSEELALKEKVETLKAEAASLGLDPSVISASISSLSSRGRGGYRGRGRGLYGNMRGRGGRVFKLDNRPTRILIKGFSEANQSLIRPHFEMYGIVESFQLRDDKSAIVHYQTRRDAEQAFIYGKKIEGITEPLELSWYTESAKPAENSLTNSPSPAVAAALAQLENKINHSENVEKEKDNDEKDNNDEITKTSIENE